tara:strand:+ start:2327 stop:3175 length:849 start_codon:yes stop_codon:yes gene_type:complete
MKTGKLLFSYFLLFLLLNCSSPNKEKKTSIIKDKSLDLQMIDAYKEGLKELEVTGDAIYAAKKFNEAELLYPQSEWASKSALMAAYSYYSQNYFDDALFELERFLKVYPKDINLDYAYYMLGMVYFENVIDEKKDINPLLKSKSNFEFVVKNFPDTEFALDSELKLELINDLLASKEMFVARFYLSSKKWISALNRFKTVLNNYPDSIFVEEALHRIVEIYYIIGLENESKKYASLLGYNYLSSSWYKESYRVFNKKYEIKRLNKKKKKSGFIKKKFKKLFE